MTNDRSCADAAPSATNTVLFGCAAIASYMGIGLRQVHHLYTHGGLPISRAGRRVWIARAAVDAWIAASPATRATTQPPDPYGTFLAACVVRLIDGKIAARSLYEAYLAYAARSGQRAVSEVIFARAMRSRLGKSAATTIAGRNCNAYMGYRLRS